MSNMVFVGIVFFIFFVLLIIAVLCIWTYDNDKKNQKITVRNQHDASNTTKINVKIVSVEHINDEIPRIASIVMYNSVAGIGEDHPCLMSVGHNKYKVSIENIARNDASNNTPNIPKHLEYIAHEESDDIPKLFEYMKNGTPCVAIVHVAERTVSSDAKAKEPHKIISLVL